MKGKQLFPLSLNLLLEQRIEKKLLRKLKTHYPKIDFSSNDYLGFSSQGILSDEIKIRVRFFLNCNIFIFIFK